MLMVIYRPVVVDTSSSMGLWHRSFQPCIYVGNFMAACISNDFVF